jgi:hypothetical protein
MKTRYIIVIGHLLLYPVTYFILILYNSNPTNVDYSDGITDALATMVESIIQLYIALAILTTIPIIGCLIGLGLKREELKYGFFISTLNSIIIALLILFFLFHRL